MITNEQREKRLEKLKYVLINHDALFPNTVFDMDTWNSGENVAKKGLASCGSAACALGSAAVLPWFRKQGLTMHDSTSFVRVPVYVDASGATMERGYSAGAIFFGLEIDDAKWLFNPETYRPDDTPLDEHYEVTREEVIERIDHLINEYKEKTNG